MQTREYHPIKNKLIIQGLVGDPEMFDSSELARGCVSAYMKLCPWLLTTSAAFLDLLSTSCVIYLRKGAFAFEQIGRTKVLCRLQNIQKG